MSLSQFLSVLVGVAAALSVGMGFAWLIWRKTNNAGWVDAVWTLALGLTGAVGAFVMPGAIWRHALIAALLAVWVLRLGSHIAGRNQKRQSDPRYESLIASWGLNAPRQMFWLLQKQAWVSIPLALTLLLAAAVPNPEFRFLDGLGVLVVAASLIGEGVADLQLRQFQASHEKGSVCDAGLWAFSRHPNYFFQWLSWCGYALIAIEFGGDYPWGWLSVLAPACMFWLLMFVSGIPPLEDHMVKTRGERYQAYQQRTNAFFPWPRKVGTR